jgi:serine O-acetyltransferase
VTDVSVPARPARLLDRLRDDLRASGGGLLTPGFHAVAVHRLAESIEAMPGPLALLLRPIHLIAYLLVRNLYGIELPAQARIGARLWIAHQGGIVVNPRAHIGDDCVLRHNVTIGIGTTGGRDAAQAPRIGNRVQVGPGAVIAGGVTIGDGARIGPNAVVMTDVPAGGSAYAAPARVLRPLTDDNATGPE